MSQRKIRKSWWVDFRYNFTRYRMRSPLNTAEGAKQYEHVLVGRLMRGEPIDGPAPVKVSTFAEFSAEWFETYVKTNNKPSEQRNKEMMLRVHLVPRFGRLPLPNIGNRDIEAYKAERLQRGLSPKTVNNELMVLRKCLASAHEWGSLGALPRIQLLKAPSYRVDYLREDECERLLMDATEPMWNGMVLMALHTGMRQGELLGLRWDAVDLERRLITVCRSDFRGQVTSPKSHRSRTIPMSELLYIWLSSFSGSTGAVFDRRDGRPLNHNMAACALVPRHTGSDWLNFG